MKQTVKQRLVHSVGATSLGPVVTAIIQLVSVPVYLHFWGPKLYGDWLVLSAIPVYLGVTDFGFGSVAGNDMTMLVARGEKEAALQVFQSVWVLTTVVSVSVGLLAGIVVWLLPIERWLKIALLSNNQVSAILCVLGVYILLDMQWTVIAAGFRCDGNYALGTLLANITRFSTNALSILVVVFNASPLFVALTLVGTRLLGNWTCQIILRRKSPWLHYGHRNADFGIIKKLFSPAVAYVALTTGNSFLYQGMIIVVGMGLGPVAVVMFSTARTLTRFAYQMVDMITNSIWPELSTAFGAGNWVLARKLHRYACQASLGLSSVAILILLLFGDKIYSFWIHGKVAMDHRLFYILLLEVLANSFWFTSSVVPLACNRHQRQSAVYVLAAALSIPTAYVLMPWLGLAGAGLSLLVTDVCMIVYVLPRSLALLHDNLREFALALLQPPPLKAAVLGF